MGQFLGVPISHGQVQVILGSLVECCGRPPLRCVLTSEINWHAVYSHLPVLSLDDNDFEYGTSTLAALNLGVWYSLHVM